ncbi:MAG: hypothetical protein EOO65_06045 [Methanosarcinales archaeon]|nr:MAG: hypothetical protein EOO65_06045 [Methanosarcinales archaeon]
MSAPTASMSAASSTSTAAGSTVGPQYAFMRVKIDDVLQPDALVFELAVQHAPKASKNFAVLCKGDLVVGAGSKFPLALRYAGSAFHRMLSNSLIQGGDFVTGDGTCKRKCVSYCDTRTHYNAGFGVCMWVHVRCRNGKPQHLRHQV